MEAKLQDAWNLLHRCERTPLSGATVTSGE